MSLAACLCVNVEITEAVTVFFLMRTPSYVREASREQRRTSVGFQPRRFHVAEQQPVSSPAIGQFINNPPQGPLSPPAQRGPSRGPCKSHSGVYHSDLRRPLI